VTDAQSWNDKIIEEFRGNEGKVGGQFQGAPLLLLTTTGAKSGRAHTTPVVYLADGDRLVVIASAAGAPHNPAWYHNLRANPTVTVEVGTETYQATAVIIEGAERDDIYARQVAVMPGFAEYQAMTSRTIPVIALERQA
jgi:deazaflavin-dependent oxidoreductase (nitroreductase family)